MASGQNVPMDPRENQQPPPYMPPAQGQQYVQDFVQQNPQGFIHTQQPGPQMIGQHGQYAPQQGGFTDISGGPGYSQPQMQQMSSSNTVVVCQNQSSPTLILRPAPYSYLVPAILSCFFCCWLVGIGAIIAAIISRGQSDDMNYEEARKSANIAKILTIVSLVLGSVFYVGIVIYSATLSRVA